MSSAIGSAALVVTTDATQVAPGLSGVGNQIKTWGTKTAGQVGAISKTLASPVTKAFSAVRMPFAAMKGWSDKFQALAAGTAVAAAGKISGTLSNSKALFAGAGTAIGMAIGGPLGAAIGGAVGGAVGGVIETIWDTITAPFDKINELAKTSKAASTLGISGEQYQGLSAQLKKVGIEGEAVGHTFALMGKNIEGAVHSKEGLASLNNLGVNIDTLKTQSLDEQFKTLADAISKLPPGAEQAAAAMHYFGKQGDALLPMLQKGSKGIDEFTEEHKKIGAILSNSQLKAAGDAAKAWKEAQNQIKALWEGLVNRFTIITAPVIKLIGGALTKAYKLLIPVFEWLGRAAETLSNVFTEVAKVVETWIDDAVNEVKSWIAELGELTGGWPTLESVVIRACKNIGIAIGYVWDTVKAGAGVIAYVAGFVVEGFGKIIGTFKETLKEIYSALGELPGAVGEFYAARAKDIDQWGEKMERAGQAMRNWGKGAFNSWGESAKKVESWFDRMTFKRKEEEAAAKKNEMRTDLKYKPVEAAVKGSKEDFSIQARFITDNLLGAGKKVEEKNNDELKKVNQKLDKVIKIFGGSLTLKAG